MLNGTQETEKQVEKKHREEIISKMNKKCADHDMNNNEAVLSVNTEHEIKSESGITKTIDKDQRFSHNPNNYHWSEQDVSQESKNILQEFLMKKNYKIEKMNIKMFLINRMNRLGFMYEMTLELEKDGKEIILKDLDTYSDIKEKDIADALEFLKAQIIHKYGKPDENPRDKEQNTNPLKRFIKIGTETDQNQIQSKNAQSDKKDQVADRPSDFNQKSLDQATQDLFKRKDFVREGPKKFNSSFTFLFVGKLTAFYSYFLDPSYFKQYAPQSDSDVIKMGCATIYNMEKSQFVLKMTDEEILIKINIQKEDSVDENENHDWTIKFEYQCQSPKQIKRFIEGYLIPRLRMTFGALIVKK